MIVETYLKKIKHFSWQRITAGVGFLGLGGVALVLGTITLVSHLTSITSETGITNSRIIRLRSPVNGTVKAFYAKPGLVVQSGQVLAAIGRGPREDLSTSLYKGQLDLEIFAPLSGVVYSTEREQYEQIKSLEPLMTVLDCSEIWVETVLKASDANSILVQKVVKVEVTGHSQPLKGAVELMQPVSTSPNGTHPERVNPVQVQAFNPQISVDWVGKPLTRVVVRFLDLPETFRTQPFCGVGRPSRLTFRKKLL